MPVTITCASCHRIVDRARRAHFCLSCAAIRKRASGLRQTEKGRLRLRVEKLEEAINRVLVDRFASKPLDHALDLLRDAL